MSKIITAPDECGFCNREENFRDIHCKHPKSHYLICDDPSKFPYQCPLHDGPTLNRTRTLILLKKYIPNILANKIIDWIYAETNN
jgi:hypothetical protein